MPMLTDYYKVLDIGNDASDLEIKKAYRQKSKQFHPAVYKEPDALYKFIEINEAYEILIHHNTRELYEEDFKTWHNPEEYPIYKYWIDAARSRANEHAKLTLDDFLKTKFYRSTHTGSYSVFMAGMILGSIVSISPYAFMVLFDNKLIGVASVFVALPAGIYMIIQSLAGFQSLKKFH
ncbi:MAG: DnaJ domain-containing protein [Bacteroidota bacterium]|jgi:curved DNA-binding protein CbpA